ncbi:uncharacterized protein [Haliotis cracherodii]|uniref:uncharacterized protein n=1 Tax=Haliotis cracherodii TaxID=6455 RepID=UPI0039EB0C80
MADKTRVLFRLMRGFEPARNGSRLAFGTSPQNLAFIHLDNPCTHSSTPYQLDPSCSDCGGNDVGCFKGLCLPRCASGTSPGECDQCRDSRFYGTLCQNDCPDTCLNSRCRINNTRVVCTEGCVAGKKGDNCEVDCPKGCSNCSRYNSGCFGQCKHNFYGQDCHKCPVNCNDGCDRQTGVCNGCRRGWRGNYCGVNCPRCEDCDNADGCTRVCSGAKYYGVNCQHRCPLQCDGCNSSTEECKVCKPCKDVLTLSTATTSMPSMQKESNETLKLVCAVLGTLLLGTFALILYKRCSRLIRLHQRPTWSPRRLSETGSASGRAPDAGGYSGSSGYRYWEIQDEDIDSGSETTTYAKDETGTLADNHKENISPELPNPYVLARSAVEKYRDIVKDETDHCKINELVNRNTFFTVRRAVSCDMGMPDRPDETSAQRSHSDSETILLSKPENELSFDSATIFEQTCDVTDVHVKYITTAVVETSRDSVV